MGQIQNAITGLVSTAIGATVAKDIKDTKEKTAYTEAVAASPELKESIAAGNEEIKAIEKDLEILNKGGLPIGEGKFIDPMGQDLAPEISKRQLSLKTLTGKQEARKLQLEGYKQTIERYRKKRGLI